LARPLRQNGTRGEKMASATAELPGAFSRGMAYALIHRRRLVPYLYVAPSISLFFLLMLYPMVAVFRYSLLDGAILKPSPQFVWFDNFVKIFSDPVFRQAIGHTLYFSIMSVVFHIIIGLSFALMLNSDRISRTVQSILRVLYILPWLFTAVIIAIIWRLILDPNGVINAILMTLHIVDFKVEWFSSSRTAIHALTFVNIWAGYPLYMVTLLAGLQGIPRDLYEAASIDGAGPVRQLWHVTLPQLKPIIVSIALLDFIWTMQVFPLVWMTTGGGPIHATEMMSIYTYKAAFSRFQFSVASASAVVLFLISMSMTYFYIKHQKAAR
jgi:multiple sugar transport system permease protein